MSAERQARLQRLLPAAAEALYRATGRAVVLSPEQREAHAALDATAAEYLAAVSPEFDDMTDAAVLAELIEIMRPMLVGVLEGAPS